ncbi:MAG: C-terminal binding protein [Anaerolineales bacterium]|nr:C-terminal binding protein [Anaerolineales bacterium]
MAGGLSDMAAWRVVRLNAALFPVDAYEAAQYAWHGLKPVEVETTTLDELRAATAEAEAVLVVSATLPAPVVAGMARCRVIARLGAGTDKLAVDTATAQGIVVANVPDFCAEEQAVHTWTLILALARQLPRMTAALAAGTYDAARALSRANQRLSGQTLGLVGFGHSAKRVARMAQGFGLRVLATRRRAGPDAEAEALGVTLTDLDTVLREADWLSLHTPLLPDTYHLLDAAALAKMKPGAALINTARGALVDEAALVAALQAGRLAGAGLDTFESLDMFGPESGPPAHPLLGRPNVIMTPHVAAGSVQAMQAVARGSVENVAAVLRGYWPPPDRIVNAGVQPRQGLRAHVPDWFSAGEATS